MVSRQELGMMNAFDHVIERVKAYDVSQHKKVDYLSHEENRGVFVYNTFNQFLGTYIEMRISEYDPTPGARQLPVGNKVDWVNENICVEQKRNPSTDNGSSRKANLAKLITYAEQNNLTPIYAYSEDRKKNDYMKDGVRHLHGSAIFKYLGIEHLWSNFTDDIERVKITIVQMLIEKYDECS